MKRVLILCALAMALLAPSSASAVPSDYVSPLFGVSTGFHGALLVADAGQGVVRRSNGKAELVVSLPGVVDVSTRDRHSLWALTSHVFGSSKSRLYMVKDGKATKVAGIGAFESNHNPHPARIDTDPFDVLKRPHKTAVVADAAGNDVLHVSRNGHIRLIATLPDQVVPTDNVKDLVGCPDSGGDICDLPDEMPAEAVATSVTKAPDGGLYVGELKGFPAPLHHSRVWHIDKGTYGAECGSDPRCQIVFDDFTSIIDLRWRQGTLYVEQIDDRSWFAVEDPELVTSGSVWACDVTALTCSQVAGGHPIMTAITFRRNGGMWGIVNALIPGQADVIRLRPPQ